MNTNKQGQQAPKSRQANQKASRQKRKNPRAAPLHQNDSAVKKAPISQTRNMRTGNPVYLPSKNGCDVVVKHREYLRDIAGSVAFAVTTVNVNPGLSSSFPWLSAMASIYESYVLEDLIFEFQTMAPSTTKGSVMSAVDYDASDPAPLDKTQLASYQGYVRSSAWSSFDQRSPKEALHKQKTFFVRSGTLGANQDVKLYDVGNFFIATQGMDDATPVGELYVSYTVRFITPQLGDIAVGLSKSQKISANTVSVASSLGNAPVVATGNTSTTLTITATAPFNCLIARSGDVSVGTAAPSSAGSTCTIQNETFLSAAPSASPYEYVYYAELAFTTGQTFVFSLGAVTWNNDFCRLAQFNTLLL